MKNFLIAAVLTLTGTQAFAMQLVVCEGKIADQDIAFIDDSYSVGIHKGKVNIATGQSGNNFPFERFTGGEIRFAEGEADICSLSVQSNRGSFTLETSCTGEGTGKIKDLNIESLGLVSGEVAVTCRHEEYQRN